MLRVPDGSLEVVRAWRDEISSVVFCERTLGRVSLIERLRLKG